MNDFEMGSVNSTGILRCGGIMLNDTWSGDWGFSDDADGGDEEDDDDTSPPSMSPPSLLVNSTSIASSLIL